MFITKVISNIIESGFRKIKVLVTVDKDVRTAQQVSPFGIDSVPIAGMKAIYAATNKNGKNVIVGYYNKSLLANDGESRLYSVDDDGAVSTFIWLKNDGTMEIGGAANHMTQYEGLATAFNTLKADLNQARAALSLPPSIADITAAKIDEIKTI